MSTKIEFVFVDDRAKAGDEEARHMLTPKKATAYSAGFDLVAANQEPLVLRPRTRVLVPTGIAIALEEGYEAQVRPRSGLALKNGLTVLNAPGTIDADYRGEVKVILANMGEEDFIVKRGMRVAQLVVAQVPQVHLQEVELLTESLRGEGGFGSSGLNA